MTGYNNLDLTAGAWSQQVKFTLSGHLFTHLDIRVVLGVTFVPGFVYRLVNLD